MNVSKYILLLNSEAKSHFITRSDQEKKRLREKLEFLENGLWDAGVRVKKLKGVSNRVVFEARLSRSDRIIFTLGRHNRGTAILPVGDFSPRRCGRHDSKDFSPECLVSGI